MNWHLNGKFYESCSCTFVCPCTWSNMNQAATNDYCRAALAFSITTGDIDGTDVSGCSMFMIIDTPPNMAEGNWTVGLIIDEKASDAQVDAVSKICSGDVGGPMELAAALVGNFAGIERANIEINKQAMSFSVAAGALFENAAVGMANADDPNVPIFIDNTAHPANKRLALATGTKSHMHVFGIDWDDDEGGHNGHFAPFEWASA